MAKTWFGSAGGYVGIIAAGLGLAFDGTVAAEPPTRATLELHARVREAAGEPPTYRVKDKVLRWDPDRTAIVICDMWDRHWCRGATRRVGELAPAMNQAVAAARARGVLIIHAPSSCMAAYKDHAARRRAQDAPRAANLPADISGWCDRIPPEEKGVYPIDQSDGGCDDGPACPQDSPWRRQIAAIEIRDEDAISDSGVEIWNLLESRHIDHVLLMGVHTNMCVLGRPFGLRQLVRHGKDAVLVRDLTDTMYNSRSWPYVSHFQGTERIIEHIEKYVAPTITSTDLTGHPAFRFRPDDRPRAVFLIGEDEYQTERTLPEFARKELEPLGIRCTFAIADPKRPHDFPGALALNDADLLVLSVRRRTRPRARWRSSAVTSKRESRSSASGRPATPSTRAAMRRRGTSNGRPSTRTSSVAITPTTTATTSSRRSRGLRPTNPHRYWKASRRRSRPRARSIRRIRWLRPVSPCWWGRSPGKPRSRWRGSTRRARHGSSTRRSATPATSRSPRFGSCCGTPFAGPSIDGRRSHRPRRRARRRAVRFVDRSRPMRPSRASVSPTTSRSSSSCPSRLSGSRSR